MIRNRIIKNMNLDWKFHRGDLPFPGYKGIDDSDWIQVTLPHDWSVGEQFSQEHASGTGYLPGGVGWYRKTFQLDEDMEGKKVYINFDGVYNNSQVWCNSYYLGKRPYGYSAFSYDITPFVQFGKSDNVISVKVDHKDIADSRWFTGAGIYRDVTLTVVDPIHIDRYGVFVTTPSVTTDVAVVNGQVTVFNESEYTSEIELKCQLLDLDGHVLVSKSTTVNIEQGSTVEINQSLNLDNPVLWSPDNPKLYIFRTELFNQGQLVDRVDTTTGIRWFNFDPKTGFSLNDVSMKLKGLCIHHDAGCLGAAVPKKVWKRRLEKFKEVGCNAIRMSHNPPAANLLDLCDEMGFLVMDEAFDEWEGVKNKWWQGHNVYPPKHYGYYEDFPEWHERDIKEMVLRDRNHPSIIAWSIGNEVDYPNDPYCHPSFKSMTGNNDKNKPEIERQYDPNKPNAERLAVIARKLVKHVKECDTTRPVTAALAFPELSNHTGYADALDIVGYNYKEHLYEKDCKEYPNRVIYGSENGKHVNEWAYVKDNDHICGQFLWTGIDFLGEAQGWPIRVSQAGLMDLTGREKTSFYLRKSLWQEKPIAHITTKDKNIEQVNWWDRGDAPHWNYNEDTIVTVFGYTNCEEVELFLNHTSLGSIKLSDCELSNLGYEMIWDVPFEPGQLKAVGKIDQEIVCECQLNTSGEGDKIKMSSNVECLQATGEDIAHVEVEIVDINGHLSYFAADLIKFDIEGPGEILGIENGNPADLEPYCSRERKVYNGKLLVYIRSTLEKGKVSLRVAAEGYESEEIILNVI